MLTLKLYEKNSSLANHDSNWSDPDPAQTRQVKAQNCFHIPSLPLYFEHQDLNITIYKILFYS